MSPVKKIKLMKKSINDEKIKRSLNDISKKIVKEMNPENIILFGSYARGTNKEHSDINLMVVFKECEDCDETSQDILNLFKNTISPLDILVTTVNIIEKCNKVGYVYPTILREGVLLH